MAIVIITGSNSGFGLEGAEAFARAGDTVYACMRDTSKAESLQESIANEKLDIRVKSLDVTQPHSFDALVSDIIAETGRIDVLVNNAGILRAGACEDLSESTLRSVMETNFFGPMLLTRAVLPQMRAQQGGKIIMISSLSGIAGLAGDVFYTASKFALEGATEALRHEVDHWGIHVALIEGGQYATHIFNSALTGGSALPDDYPKNSPYRELIERRLQEMAETMPQALNPKLVGDLMVEVARSDGSQLRWQADGLAKMVVTKLWGQTDAERDAFLRGASGIDWWSESES